jgi:hypothetical protein
MRDIIINQGLFLWSKNFSAKKFQVHQDMSRMEEDIHQQQKQWAVGKDELDRRNQIVKERLKEVRVWRRISLNSAEIRS